MDNLSECQYAALFTATDSYSVETFNMSPSVFVGLNVEDLCEAQPVLH